MMNTLLLFLLSIALCLADSSYGKAPTNPPPYDEPEEPEQPGYDDEPEEAEEPEPEEPGYDEPEEAEEPEPEEPSYGQETETPTMAPTNKQSQYSAPTKGSPAPKMPDGVCTKGQWQCQSVTKDYNFVKCLYGKCACRTDRGFSGSATVADPCACKGGNVYWRDNNAYCLNASQVAYCAANQYPLGSLAAGTQRCANQWQCEAVSKDYNFVGCVKTSGSFYCQCNRRAGFGGAATADSPCKCHSPKKVVWLSNRPYCLDVRTCNNFQPY